MNAQVRMYACQLRLYFFPGCVTLYQVIQRNGIEWWPYPRLFWSHPYLSPRLRRSSSPTVLCPIHPPQWRRPGSAWTADSSASRLGCWAPQLTVGHRSCVGSLLLASVSTTQQAWSAWRPCARGKRTARCPSWNVTPQIPHAISPLVSPRRVRGRVPFQYLHLGTLGDPPAGA